MKRVSLLSLVICMAASMWATTVSYTADDTSVFSNPERGFITMLEGHLSTSDPYAVKGEESTLNRLIADDHMSLVLVHYYLENYRTTATIPASVLNAFDEDMQVLRSKGLKAIIRFSYTNTTYIKGSGEESAKDATLSIAQAHIRQYAPHWQANADVIFAFQAGFVGAWGEWYYTDNFGNQSSSMNANRSALLDTLLAYVPQDRCIQLRTPKFKTEYVGNTAPLTASEAYSGSAKARLGHHNDAFLYGAKNQGTYTDTATQKPYLAQETLYVPIGGESNIEDAAQAATDASYQRTTAEMSRLHWTFIQGQFTQQVTNMWRQNGTFDELNRKMGYRYQLVSGTYQEQVAAGQNISVSLRIRNAGYAPLYNERHAYIVLRNSGRSYALQLQSDPRTWLPNGAVTTVTETLRIPANIPDGTYDLYLHMPDAYSSIANDARYAVRFANTNMWDEATGMNNLNATLTVTDSQAQPVVSSMTFDKSNVAAYSDDMTWYNTNYFDFGPGDAPNTDRWAEWAVDILYPGEYIVTVRGYYPNGHQWQLSLQASGAEAYALPASWGEGEQSETGEQTWDLSNVPAGTYTLRIQNIMEWGQPKLRDITLQYDGELPEDIDTSNTTIRVDGNHQTYDLLGRPVDESYQGIVIRNGEKILQFAR